MTGSPTTNGNPSRDPSQPVQYQPVTRPPVPPIRDGSAQPVNCGNTIRDGWTGRRRTRPTVPKPQERTPQPTDPANPSHTNTNHTADDHTDRSAHHAAPTRTDADRLPTDGTGDTRDSADTADSLDSDRVSRPNRAPPHPTLRRPHGGRHKEGGNHARRSPGTATANPKATVPTPDHAVMRARLAAMAQPDDDDDAELADDTGDHHGRAVATTG